MSGVHLLALLNIVANANTLVLWVLMSRANGRLHDEINRLRGSAHKGVDRQSEAGDGE